MKTTPEGLTHLINMLADVVNLQRKAQGTSEASCDVCMRLDEDTGRMIVVLSAEVNVAAASGLSADNNQGSERMLTPADLDAAEMALRHSQGASPRQAAQLALAAVGLGLPR